jgi:hypothetical protein
MTTLTRSAAIQTNAPRLRVSGLVGAVSGVLGAALALAIIFWPPMVGQDRFSYPFDASWFVLAQLLFAVQHVGMLPVFLGVLVLERRRPSRTLRLGTWLALIGQGALIAGVGALRVQLWKGAGRWLLLALGVYVFVVLFPAVFGPLVAGRIAIGAWSLMFAWLGLLLAGEARS